MAVLRNTQGLHMPLKLQMERTVAAKVSTTKLRERGFPGGPLSPGSSLIYLIMHFINSPYNFSTQSCPQNSDRVQLRIQSPKRCIIKHLKPTKLNSIEFLRTEMTSDLSNYHREYSPYGSYSLFQFERSDVISVLKNSIEYSFVFFKCLLRLLTI